MHIIFVSVIKLKVIGFNFCVKFQLISSYKNNYVYTRYLIKERKERTIPFLHLHAFTLNKYTEDQVN